MKITRVETHVCNARMRNWIFVKVLTDQDGLFGWGEATLEWHTRAVVGAVEDLAELIVGEDPTRVEHLWQMMYRQHFWHGHGIVRAAEAAVAAMREAVGDSVDIMVDCHARPSPAMGLQFAKALEPYGLYFLEEPCWPESIAGLAAIKAAVATPIATGERVTHLAAFRDLFAARALDVCQLDITHCGGFTEARRI